MLGSLNCYNEQISSYININVYLFNIWVYMPCYILQCGTEWKKKKKHICWEEEERRTKEKGCTWKLNGTNMRKLIHHIHFYWLYMSEHTHTWPWAIFEWPNINLAFYLYSHTSFDMISCEKCVITEEIVRRVSQSFSRKKRF